jgi:hypothetical protein
VLSWNPKDCGIAEKLIMSVEPIFFYYGREITKPENTLLRMVRAANSKCRIRLKDAGEREAFEREREERKGVSKE